MLVKLIIVKREVKFVIVERVCVLGDEFCFCLLIVKDSLKFEGRSEVIDFCVCGIESCLSN